MKKLISLTICILFIYSACYSQETKQTNSAIDSTNIIKDTVFNANLEKQCIDTVYYSMHKDNTINLSNNPNIGQVVIIEKTNDIDKFLNYIIPVLTLILGIFIEKVIEQSNIKKKVTRSGKRWRAEFQSLLEPLQKQIESFNSFIRTYNENEFMIPDIIIYQELDSSNLKILDKSDFLEYLESKKKVKEPIKIFNKASGIIAILDSVYKNVQEKFNEFLSRSSQHTDSFTKNLQDYGQSLVKLSTLQSNRETQVFTPEDFRQLEQLFENNIAPHLEDGRMNPFELETTFFIPNIALLGKYYENPAIIPISTAITGCMNDIRSLKMEKIYIKENLTEFNTRYNELSESVGEILNKLENA